MTDKSKRPHDPVEAACRAFCAFLSVRGWGDAPIADINEVALRDAMEAALDAAFGETT